MAGVHGLERRSAAGVLHRYLVEEQPLAEVRNELRLLVCAHAGLLLEDKGCALALHFRRAPELASVAHQAMQAAAMRLGPAFATLEGHQCIELKPGKPDKATAIETFLDEWPFSGRTPVFIGDDVTDNDGFRVVREHGGICVAVGDRVSAEHQLVNPRAVSRWLGGLLASNNPWR